MRDAFKDARTEIEGGVALSGFIGVRDTEQNVAAAMAGYNPTGESDYPLIFAGAQQGNVEYYGWTSNSYTHIYTQSATPSNGDNCFDNKGSVVGTVTNIVGAQIFALSTTGETYQRNTGIDQLPAFAIYYGVGSFRKLLHGLDRRSTIRGFNGGQRRP